MEAVTGAGLGRDREGQTIRLTENQLKVIRDKYLKDAKSPEAWLRNVARNIALGELLHAPEFREAIFEGVKHHSDRRDEGEGKVVETVLLHYKQYAYREREANFKRFMANLYALIERNPSAAKLVDEAEEKFYRRMADFEFLPNSPTLMNAGRELQQLSACYVLPVPDSIEGIFGAVKNQALIHKSGGGTGFSFGRIRPADDQVQSTMGIASGPISFMKIFDAATEQVKQGGTRRGANMAILPYWHPNVVDFITMKRKRGNTTLENFNISVGIDAPFMDAVKKGEDVAIRNPRTGETVRTMPARELFTLMVECAWECGDPGYVVLDRINNSGSNPTPALGEIEATNPCVVADTLVLTLEGPAPISSLVGRSVGVVAYDRENGRSCIRTMTSIRMTRANVPTLRVRIEGGPEIVCTEDHNLIRLNGSKVTAKELVPGEVLAGLTPNRAPTAVRVSGTHPAGFSDVYNGVVDGVHTYAICDADPIKNVVISANCGEQPLLPNEPCNLGSINLYKFVTGHNGSSSIDWERLRETVFDCIHFLDNVIDLNDYPVPEIEEMAKGNRRIGLGVMGWAETLVSLHIRYDSELAIEKAEEVMSFINKAALEASIRLADKRGVFPNWQDSIYDPEGKHFRGEHARPRNCARTTIAPTGTIAIAAGLQGSGIEPFFAVAYTRYNAKGLDALKAGREPATEDTFFEVNPQFRAIAEANRFFGLTEANLWKKISANHKSVRGIPEIPKDVQDLFATAHEVSFEHHIAVQAAFQKFTDNAVSKTINCANETTKEDIGRAYMLGYDLGVKGLTVYRDGSKTHQVLNLSAGGQKEAAPAPSRRPASEHGVTSEYYEKMTGYGPLHVNIVYDQHGPFRVFANIPPLGTEIAGLTAVIGILLSKYLETGGKAEKILKHLNSVKGDKPLGFGPNRVESIPHALSQILREHLKKHGHLTVNGNGNGAVAANSEPRAAQIGESATCPKCYSTNVEFVNGCKEPTCFDCGYSNCS